MKPFLLVLALAVSACAPGSAPKSDAGDPDGGPSDGGDAGEDGELPCPGELTRCGDECVDLTTDDAHCGDCIEQCEPSEECVDSICEPLTCVTQGCPMGSYCDGALCQPGCDADAACPQPGACNLAAHSCECAWGTHLCGASCVDDGDATQCGESCTPCQAPVGGGVACLSGMCERSCPLGYTECAGNCIATTSTGNCGGNCTVCAVPLNGLPTCDGSNCGVSCNVGFHPCGTECLSNTSVSSCGTSCISCPVPANGSATCDGTSCGVACNAGFARCGELCVAENPDQCGTACETCSSAPANASPVCASGACTFECNLGYLRCGTACCPAIDIAAGYGHSCAILGATLGSATGRVVCWGGNVYRQIGDGTTTRRPRPTDTTGLGSNVSALSAGSDHSCAIQSGGLKCWGYGAYGQIGNGSSFDASTPVSVTGMTSGVAQVSAGERHTCAVTTGGALRCWGSNSYGRLGMGDQMSSNTPRTVYGAGAVAVAAGGQHTCAILTDGSVTCWGYAHYGQLGINRTLATDCGTGFTDPYCKTSPTAVAGITDVVAIAAGGQHTCAIRAGGELRCWGNNHKGQLGLGSGVDWTHTPTVVPGLSSGVVAVSLGSSHTCALLSSGGIRCWGYNDYGQVGNGWTSFSGTYCGPSAAPTCDGAATTVLGFETGGGARISAGTYHSCARDTIGALYCWGYNSSGQLGDETTTSRSSRVRVTGR
jgi:alpha-tubulin suppressor-like RCC1 family protein